MPMIRMTTRSSMSVKPCSSRMEACTNALLGGRLVALSADDVQVRLQQVPNVRCEVLRRRGGSTGAMGGVAGPMTGSQNATGRADGPPRARRQLSCVLPGAVRGAAGAGGDARGVLGDRERLAALGHGVDRVGGGGRRRDGDRVRVGARRDAGAGEDVRRARRLALGVVLRVGVARLDLAHGVTSVGLGRGVLGLLLLAQEAG